MSILSAHNDWWCFPPQHFFLFSFSINNLLLSVLVFFFCPPLLCHSSHHHRSNKPTTHRWSMAAFDFFGLNTSLSPTDQQFSSAGASLLLLPLPLIIAPDWCIITSSHPSLVQLAKAGKCKSAYTFSKIAVGKKNWRMDRLKLVWTQRTHHHHHSPARGHRSCFPCSVYWLTGHPSLNRVVIFILLFLFISLNLIDLQDMLRFYRYYYHYHYYHP